MNKLLKHSNQNQDLMLPLYSKKYSIMLFQKINYGSLNTQIIMLSQMLTEVRHTLNLWINIDLIGLLNILKLQHHTKKEFQLIKKILISSIHYIEIAQAKLQSLQLTNGICQVLNNIGDKLLVQQNNLNQLIQLETLILKNIWKDNL